jgi:hypothetical protein
MPCGSPSPTYCMSLTMQFYNINFWHAQSTSQHTGARGAYLQPERCTPMATWGPGDTARAEESGEFERGRACSCCVQQDVSKRGCACASEPNPLFWGPGRGCRPEAERMRTGHPAQRGWCESAHRKTTLQPRKQTRTGTCFWGLCICPGMEVLPNTVVLSGDGGKLTKPLWRYPQKLLGNIAAHSGG